MIGKTVGNYRIVSRLGEGGMGEVFLAAHPDLGRKAAVKILREDLARGSDHVQRFLNEARAADAIHHPAIVKVLDMGTMPSGAPYIVMEFLEGETLGARLRRQGLFQPRIAADIVARAADALAAAHAAGIVHRDLKPDNLFLVQDGTGKDVVKVLDFGIAKLGDLWQKSVSVQTQTGVIMGTPVYMSPELCSGARHVDHRSDVYSLGIILYEMLCGEPPFQSEGFGELAHLHLSATPIAPSARNPQLPQALSELVLRALAKSPSDRFASMTELGAALAPWAAGVDMIPLAARTTTLPVNTTASLPAKTTPFPAKTTPLPAKTTPLPAKTSGLAGKIKGPARSARRRWLVVLSALVLIGSGGVYLWSVRSSSSPTTPSAPERATPETSNPSSATPTAPPAPPPALHPEPATGTAPRAGEAESNSAEITTPSPAADGPPLPLPGKLRATPTRRRPPRATTPEVAPTVKRREPIPL